MIAPAWLFNCLAFVGQSPAEKAGEVAGQIVAWLLIFCLGLWCCSAARRPDTNPRCAYSLGIFFFALLVTGLIGAYSSMAPVDARPLKTLSSFFTGASMLVAFGLAIVGLAEFSGSAKYSKGRGHAIWTIVLVAGMLALSAKSLVKGFQAGRLHGLGVLDSQPAAGEPLTFDNYNFKLRAPGKPWVQLDAKKINKVATAAFSRTAPPVYFMVIAENTGIATAITSESMAEIAKANLRSGADTFTVLNEHGRTLQDMDGIQIDSEGRVHGLHQWFRHWVFCTNGYAYQLMGWGNFEDASQGQADVEQFIQSFSLIDPDRHAQLASAPSKDFHSKLFNYSVAMAASGLRASPMMAKTYSLAEFAAWDEFHNAGLFVMPVSLLDQNADDDAIHEGMAAAIGFPYPGPDIQNEKLITEGPLNGVEFNFTSSGTDLQLSYLVRILRYNQQAYLVAAYHKFAPDDDGQKLRRELDRVKFSNSTQDGNLEEYLTGADQLREARALNSIGLFYFNSRQFEKSIGFFRKAFQFDRKASVYLANIAKAEVKAGRQKEALDYFDSYADLIKTNNELRATRASLQMQVGQIDAALTNFSAAFSNGLKNEEYFVEYVELLNHPGQHDAALAAVEDYRQKSDSTSIQLLEARLLIQKKQIPKAVELLKSLHEKYPYNGDVAISLVGAYYQSALYADAVRICDQLIDTQTDTANAYYLKGCNQVGLKRYREAKITLELALKEAPANVEVKHLLDSVSGMLGEGNNSGLKNSIAAVPIPDAVLQHAPSAAPPEYLKDYGARYLKSITAISFVKSNEFKRTEHMEIKVADASGVAAFSTIQFQFDPLAEEIYVNDLKVLDEDGSVAASGDVNDYYVVDAATGAAVSQYKILNIPVSGLRPGCRIQLTVTRRDLVAPGEFPFVAEAALQAFPTLEKVLIVEGDTNRIKAAGFQADKGTPFSGGIYWRWEQPEIYKWEPLARPAASYAPTLFVGDNSTTWESLSKNYLTDLADYFRLDEAGRKLAADATKNSKDDGEKIFSLARYVQTNYTYKALEFGRRARIPHKTSEILHNEFGDCKDHALLLQQMLEASGIPARLALVNTQGQLCKDVPSLDQFDHMIVYLPKFRGGFFLDCTDKGSDLSQAVPYGLANKEVFVLEAAKPQFISLPDYPDGSSKLVSQCEVSITNNTDVAVHETISLSGNSATVFRTAFKTVQPSARRTYMNQMLNGQSAQLLRFDLANLEDTRQPLMFDLEYVVKRQFHRVGDELAGKLPDVWEQVFASAEPVEQRTTPFELNFPIDAMSTIDLQTPPGYQALKPSLFQQQLQSDFSACSSDASSTPTGITIRYRVVRGTGKYPASDYKTFQENMVKILGPIEQTVAFAKMPEGGN
jgi:tetratricopeptide (TPR) repeat protein